MSKHENNYTLKHNKVFRLLIIARHFMLDFAHFTSRRRRLQNIFFNSEREKTEKTPPPRSAKRKNTFYISVLRIIFVNCVNSPKNMFIARQTLRALGRRSEKILFFSYFFASLCVWGGLRLFAKFVNKDTHRLTHFRLRKKFFYSLVISLSSNLACFFARDSDIVSRDTSPLSRRCNINVVLCKGASLIILRIVENNAKCMKFLR